MVLLKMLTCSHGGVNWFSFPNTCQYQEVIQKDSKDMILSIYWGLNTATVDSLGWWGFKWKDYLPTVSGFWQPPINTSQYLMLILFSHSAAPASSSWSQINLRYRSNMGSYWAKGDRKIQVYPQATNPVTKRVHRIQRNLFCFWNPPATDSQLATFFFRTTIPPKWKPVHLGRVRRRPNLRLMDLLLFVWVKLGWQTEGLFPDGRTDRPWMKW